MSFSDLEEIEKLVHHLWDAAALICLENASLRYTELRREMKAWSGRRLTDTELTRTRRRLVDGGLIRVELSQEGHNVYALTEAGMTQLYKIRRLAQTVPNLEPTELNAGDTNVDRPGGSNASFTRFERHE